MDQKPRVKSWAEGLGMELEEALALLIMLDEMSPSMRTKEFRKEIEELQDVIATQEVEKMLGGNNGNP
jgi:hypothetical protein